MERSYSGRPARFLRASSTGYLFEGRGMKKAQRKVVLYDAKDAREIPMGRLLDVLGVWHDKRGNVRCPFPEHHNHRDADPSAEVYLVVVFRERAPYVSP